MVSLFVYLLIAYDIIFKHAIHFATYGIIVLSAY